MSSLSTPKYFYTKRIYNIGPELCDLLGNIGNFYDRFDGLTQSIADDQVEQMQMQVTQNQNYQLMIIMSIVLDMKQDEFDLLFDKMVNMDKQSRDGATRPFKLSSV
jgi:phage-related protein